MPRYLPTLSDLRAGAPQVDAARRRLGGRGSSEAGVGALVELVRTSTQSERGVVLFVAGNELDVWVGRGRVERVLRNQVSPLAQPYDSALRGMAGDIQVFVHLHEGKRVRYLQGESMFSGTLVEKCRYGALVLRDDGHIMAVGFRKLFPAPEHEATC